MRWNQSPVRQLGTGLVMLCLLSGCDQIKQEVAKLQAPPPTAVPAPPVPVNPPAVPVAVAPVVVPETPPPRVAPPPTPEEILAAFDQIPGPRRSLERIEEVARLPIAGSAITRLDLSSAPISAGSLAAIAPLTKLNWLRLAATQLQDADLVGLPPMPNLNTVILDGTQFRGAGFGQLARLPALRELSLRSIPILDPALEGLGLLPQLEVLHLDDNRTLQGRELGLLIMGRKLSALRVLTVNNTRLGELGLQTIAALKNLEELTAHSAQVSDLDVREVSKCPRLKSLVIAFSPVTDAGLKALVGSDALEHLDISGCRYVTNEGLNSLSKLKGLKKLILTETSVTGDAVQVLAQKFLKDTVIVFGEQEF